MWPGTTLTVRPGIMTASDVAGYRAKNRAPTHVAYRGLDVYGMAPPSSGGLTTGEALNILSGFNLSAESSTQALFQYLEASRLAFADRNAYIGDSDFVPVPQQGLLDPAFAATRRCLIGNTALTSPVAPGTPHPPYANCATSNVSPNPVHEGTQTNHLVVADKWGNVVSYTNTIEQLAGSGMTVPGRGFLLNNEMTDFDFAPATPATYDPNLPAAGKRPRSSMSPTIVLKNGEPRLHRRLAGRLDHHHHRAADPAQPRRLRHDAAAGDRRTTGQPAQCRDNGRRAGLLHQSGRPAADISVRRTLQAADRSRAATQLLDRQRHRHRPAARGSIPGRRRASALRRRQRAGRERGGGGPGGTGHWRVRVCRACQTGRRDGCLGVGPM